MSSTPAAGPALNTRYVLHERLGTGGQGEVWRAHDPERGEDIALKILRPAPGRSAAVWEALLHEYQSASSLDHPHILRVYTPERDGMTFLLPMELASGGDLRRLRGASYLAVVPVLLEVAAALEHAHARGVIHRDLKPGNVLFDARGQVKLADFGVSGQAPDPGTDAMIRGLSPFTASPQQLRGEPPTPADDIYGLGALAYELLSRYPPHYPHFDARRVQEEPAPPLVPAEQVPPQLAELISRLLAKDARARPASMREVIEDLEASLNDTLTFDFDSEPPADELHADPPAAPAAAAQTPVTVAPATVTAAPASVTATPASVRAVTAAASPAPPSAPSSTPEVARAAAPAEPPWAALQPEGAAAAPMLLEDEGLKEALRRTRIPGPRLEPMRSVVPRILLVLVVLGGAVVFGYLLLARYYGVVIPGLALPSVLLPHSAAGPAARAPAAPPVLPAGQTAPPQGTAGAAPPAALSSAFGDDRYARAAGEGYAALGAGRLDEARAAFAHALEVRPDGAEALEGLRRVDAETHARGQGAAQGGVRGHAEELEAQERWADALAAYEAVLRRDGTASFAQAGRARAIARLQLHDALQDLIDHPEQLTIPQERQQAALLLQTAQEQPSPGRELRTQMARLGALLPELDKPVHVSLVSDNLTQVSIPEVGQFGSFAVLDLELKPGRYTVIGTRAGYREVHRDLTIGPGAADQVVRITCDDTT